MISDKISSQIVDLPSIQNIRIPLHRAKRIIVMCGICRQSLSISINPEFLKQVESFPFPHLILHTHSAHAMHGLIVYIDAQGHIRGTECVESVQFTDETEIFSVKKPVYK